MEVFAYQGLIGLSSAMYLWLVSAGLTIIFGVLGVLNFAHGSLFMLGAYLGYTLYGLAGVPFGLAVLGSMAVVALVGAGVERGLLRPLYGLDPSYQLLLTFGLVLFLDDLAKLVWGGVFRIPPIPGWLQG
ncbi:MAG: branched-chain amino acid ABC transporter permease, partial [Armatimonadota bacterium]|nr:branched-chain amino acid ABC transporter permease [Armatimonadota bacterium]